MKVEISNNSHLLPDDDDDDDDVSFPCLETSRNDSDSTWATSEEQEHEQSPARNKPLNDGEALIGGSSSSWSDISECIRRPLKCNILFSSSQKIVSPRSPRSQMINLSSRVPLSGSFPSAFRQSPYGTNYWGGRPYCPAQSNQNYYRRVIIRPHPHREHDKNSSIHVAPPPPLPYIVSPHSYLPPIHFGVPFIVPGSSSPLSPTHMPLPTRPPALTVLVVKQIDHYFSEENLETDHHLKSLMDDQGWVHVHHIVNFRRISNLTKNITLILKSLIARSNVVEVKDKSIRRKNGWEKWIRKSDDRVSNDN